MAKVKQLVFTRFLAIIAAFISLRFFTVIMKHLIRLSFILLATLLVMVGCTSSHQEVPGAYPPSRSYHHMNNKTYLIKQLTAQGVQVVELGDNLTIILYTDCCFEQGTANINESCYPVMDNITALIKLYGNVPIKVAGYTDDVDDECDSCTLSRHLADSVVAYLWAHGISFQRMRAVGYGDNKPIASTHTVRGNAFNRRVEITLRRAG